MNTVREKNAPTHHLQTPNGTTQDTASEDGGSRGTNGRALGAASVLGRTRVHNQ